MLCLCAEKKSFANEEVITVFTGDQWPPYVAKELTSFGLYPHITTSAFNAVGVKVKYIFFPWKRSLETVREGNGDASGYWASTSDREQDFYLSDPIHNEEIVFYHLKNYPFHWSSLDDIKDITIGAIIGYSYGDAFDKAASSGRLTVHRVPTDTQAFRMLHSGRINIFPLNKGSGYPLIQQIFPLAKKALFTHHPKAVYSYSLHLLFPRDLENSKRLLNLFNEGLRRLKESGRYNQILDELN